MSTSVIDVQWASILGHADERLRKAAERASREPLLRRLYPYPSMSRLRFSVTNEYPYDCLPYILASDAVDRYEARGADNAPFAQGDLDVVVPALVRALVQFPAVREVNERM